MLPYPPSTSSPVLWTSIRPLICRIRFRTVVSTFRSSILQIAVSSGLVDSTVSLGYYTGSGDYPIDLSTGTQATSFDIWLATMVSVAVGLIFSIRSVTLLAFSRARHCLPYSRLFIIFTIFIATLVALESCLYYQVL